MAKKFEIRNSTAEFLTFVAEGKEQGIQVLYKDETVWATQKAMAQLFDCSTDNIGLHLKNIYDTNELNKEATTEKISVVQQEGAREVRRNTLFYNLDAIISVGYRVNSIRATQFRQWCTYIIRQFSLRGYIIDKNRTLQTEFACLFQKNVVPLPSYHFCDSPNLSLFEGDWGIFLIIYKDTKFLSH